MQNRKTKLENTGPTNEWAKDAKKAVPSPMNDAKTTLLIAGVVLVAVPVLIFLIFVIVRSVLKCRAKFGKQGGAGTGEGGTPENPTESSIEVLGNPSQIASGIPRGIPVSTGDSQHRQVVFKI